jgi:cobalt-precorrin-7 (C5)-methyltransferase
MNMITVIGCGPGNPSYLLPAAKEAICAHPFICGAQRLLGLVDSGSAERIALPSGISEMMSTIRRLLTRGSTGVLVSGDPSVFSLTRLIKLHFPGQIREVIPGIGAGQVALGRLLLDGNTTTSISLHGRLPSGIPVHSLQWNALYYMGSRDGYQWLAEWARYSPNPSKWYWCEDLTLETERICEVTTSEIETMTPQSTGQGLVIIVQTQEGNQQ